MSTALAIASVTQVLKDLLNDGLVAQDVTGTMGGPVTVTSLPPDRIDTGTTEPRQLNLFLYHVTPNQGWRNQGLPSRDVRGERLTNPPLAVDLHYLLTAYGAEELQHEILLGFGMQLLHETPILTRDAIRTSLAKLPKLATSGLAEQIEQIRITPEVMNTEEISRLWTAFGAKYRANAAYKVTVVLIESRKSTKAALPVRDRKIYVVPFKMPDIDRIGSRAGPADAISDSQKILSGYSLVLIGNGLRGEVVSVKVDGNSVTPAPGDISDTRIIIPLPATLPAGIHSVQVIHEILMGSPPLPHQGSGSNVQAFVLSPQIVTGTVGNVRDMGQSFRSADISLAIKPGIGVSQRITLFLNELGTAEGTVPAAYSFALSPEPPHSPPALKEDITVPVTGVKAGKYLIRIQVDGAESPLQTDIASGYAGPQITIP